MDVWRERTLHVTAVLVVASFLLIGPSLLGVGGSWHLTLALGLLAIALTLVQTQRDAFPVILEFDSGRWVKQLWLAPLVAATVVLLVEPSANPGELRALGGILGLLGIVNYLVRPLYLSLFEIARRLVGRATVSGR